MELKVFDQPEKGKGPYFEFNISSTANDYYTHGEGSLYLQDEVFNAFTHCFEMAPSQFNYFGPTCYVESNLASLQEALEKYGAQLATITNAETFIKTVGLSTMGNEFLHELERSHLDLKTVWSDVRDALLEINRTLIELSNQCRQKHCVLWTLGI